MVHAAGVCGEGQVVTVRRLVVTDSSELYNQIDSNRLYLTNLAWTATATINSVTDYVVATNASNDELYGVFVDDSLCGCVTLRDKGDHKDIGYWLAHQHRERGVMKRAVALVTSAVDCPITARVLHDNIASRRILLANGFVEQSSDEMWRYFVLAS